MAQQLRIQGRFGFRNVRLVKSEENSLGNGSYGAVYKAKCDQLVCAAKVLHPILFQTRDPSAYRIVERFQREIDFLSGLRHPNVIQYLGSCADPETRMPILFMELMDESLTSFLERPADPPPLPLHVQVDIGHDVAQALSHLHRHDVLHRDLSSNNVLLTGSRRAKVTDFGMAKLLGSDPRLTPTYCPGTNGYMSPEALADPPAYTSKLDVFSCGVLFVQIITCKWPDPGPRMHVIKINDPRVPSGQVHVVTPELERRKEHLDLISPTHPLLDVALDCLKDKEGPRPTAEQLCSRLIALKESAAYRDSLQQTPEETTGQTPPARDQELEQQLRERVEDLTREVQQLTLQNEEQTTSKGREIRQLQQQIGAQSRQKDQEIRQLQQQIQTKIGEVRQLQQQLQSSRRESEQVVAALQQSVEQKDAVIRAKNELLQEKEREIRELQQRVREMEGSGVATGPLKLKWSDGPPAPFATCGNSVALSGDMFYCYDSVPASPLLRERPEDDGKKKGKDHAGKGDQKKHMALSKAKSDTGTDAGRGRSLSNLFSRKKPSATAASNTPSSPKTKKQHEPFPKVPTTGAVPSPTHLHPHSPPPVPAPLPPSEEEDDDPSDGAYDMIDIPNPRGTALLKNSNVAKAKSASLPSNMQSAGPGMLHNHGPLPELPEESAGGLVVCQRVAEDMDPEYDTVVLGQVMDDPSYDSVEVGGGGDAMPKLEPAEPPSSPPAPVAPEGEGGQTPANKYARVSSHAAVVDSTFSPPDLTAHAQEHEELGYAVIPAHFKMQKRAMSDAMAKKVEERKKSQPKSVETTEDIPISSGEAGGAGEDTLRVPTPPMEPEYEAVTDAMKDMSETVPATSGKKETSHASVDMAAKRRSQMLKQQSGGASDIDDALVCEASPNPPPVPQQGDLGDLSEFQKPPVPLQTKDSLQLIDPSELKPGEQDPGPGYAKACSKRLAEDGSFKSTNNDTGTTNGAHSTDNGGEEENTYDRLGHMYDRLDHMYDRLDPMGLGVQHRVGEDYPPVQHWMARENTQQSLLTFPHLPN